MNAYRHTVCYYETDRMGITHHSNYIRWMEEARIDFLSRLGWGYDKLEAEGILSPVIGIECKYRHSTTFPDDVFIDVKVMEFKGVRLKLKYIMTNAAGEVVCEAASEHCFNGPDGKLLRLNREHPEFYNLLVELAQEED